MINILEAVVSSQRNRKKNDKPRVTMGEDVLNTQRGYDMREFSKRTREKGVISGAAKAHW